MSHSKRTISLLLLTILALQLGQWDFVFGASILKPNKLPATAVQSLTVKPQAPIVPPKIAPPDWSAVDWDKPVVLPKDLEDYNSKLRELAGKRLFNDIKKLQKKTRNMKNKEVMDYFSVPFQVQEVVNQYTKNGTAPVGNKEELQGKIKSLGISIMPSTVKTDNLTEDSKRVIDARTAKRINVKKSIPYTPGIKQPYVKGFEIKEFNQRQIPEKYRYQIPDKKNPLQSFFNGIKDYFIPAANAQTYVPLIEYYNGIEKNLMDYALYYFAQNQNSDGSFGKNNQFIRTAEVIDALARFGRFNNDAFRSAIDYAVAYTPENNHEKAVKIRLLRSLGQNYASLLAELLATRNSDGGYGIQGNYTSDPLSTIEVLETLTAIQYSADNSIAQAINYLTIQIKPSGAMYFTAESEASYYLVNRALWALYPYRGAIVTKIDALLNFLRSNFNEETSELLLSNDAIDEAMTAITFALYNTEQNKQNLIAQSLKEKQHSNGSFGGDILSTLYASKALAQPDLAVTDVVNEGSLVNRSPAGFRITVKNKGYKPSAGTDLYAFVDNFKFSETLNIESQGSPIPPNGEGVISFAFPDTISFIGATNIKFYLEPDSDSNYANNWQSKDFMFAPPANNAPALPVFYIAQKWEIGGSPALNVRWQIKADANRNDYLYLWRQKGTTQWNIMATGGGNGAFLSGGFTEGVVYEVTIGVLHQDSTTMTYFTNATDVKVSGDSSLYKGTLNAYVTENADRAPGVPFNGYGFSISEKTDANGAINYGNIGNGASIAYVNSPQYEKLSTRFLIPIDATSDVMRIFTHLKNDTAPPVISNFELRYLINSAVSNQNEKDLIVWGSDNVGIKEADFYYWDPVAQSWIFIATGDARGQNEISWKWYVPASLLGNGFKMKAVLRDFQGNESAPREWGPFRIIDGTPPRFTVTSPNGGNVWPLGSTQTITWDTQAANSVSRVNIGLVYPDAAETIGWGVNNTGYFGWMIPNSSYYAGDHLKIRIAGYDDLNYQRSENDSDAEFSITDTSPSPQNPWGRPVKLSDISQNNPPYGNIQNAITRYDKNGVLHLLYYYLSDRISDSQRVITQQFIYQKKQNGTWTSPNIIYQKVQPTDGSMIGYTPIQNLQMELDSYGNPYLVWQSHINNDDGCLSWNTSEIYSMRYNYGRWYLPENISNNNTESLSPDLAVADDNSAYIYAAWTDGLNRSADCRTDGTVRIDYKNTFRSASWDWYHTARPTIGIIPSVPQIAITGDGRVHFMYYDTVGGIGGVYHAFFDGRILSPAVRVVTGPSDSDDLKAGANNSLHYVYRQIYRDPASGATRERIMYDNFNSTAWNRAVEISPAVSGYQGAYPRIILENNGDPHVIYEQYKSATSEKNLFWVARKNNIWFSPRIISLQSQVISTNTSSLTFDSNHTLSAAWINPYARFNEIFHNEANLSLDYVSPVPVANVQVTPWPRSIKISWDRYQDNVGDFDHFSIYRIVDPQVKVGSSTFLAQITDVNAVDYLDRTAVGGIQYYYAVTAVDRNGNEYTDVAFTGPAQIMEIFPIINLSSNSAIIQNDGTFNFSDAFGIVGLNTNNDAIFTIKNAGTAPLIFTGNPLIQIRGADAVHFKISAQPPISILGPGQFTSFTLRFTPASGGEKPARLVISNNDLPNNPYAIALKGYGMADPFTKINQGAIVTDQTYLTGASWGDYNGDGKQDVFVTNARNGGNRQNYLYKNNGNGTFTKLINPVLSSGTAISMGSSWTDFNNDGNLDLFVANNGQPNYLFINKGNAVSATAQFQKVTTGTVATDTANSMSGSWGDYNNDGYLDLFVANWSQNNALYKNNGNGSFTKISVGPIVNDGGWSYGGYWGDYNNDGHLDLFVVRGNNQSDSLYKNNGDGIFTKITGAEMTSDRVSGYGANWVDYNNDGYLDLFVANEGNDFLYKNDGDGTFTKILDGPIANSGGTSIGSAWSDFDNDGNVDLYVANANNQNNFLFKNNGDGTFAKVNVGLAATDRGDSYGANFSDYDNDGDMDLFVTNNLQGRFLYKNNGDANKWISIFLIGYSSNRTGIGARVKVKTRINGIEKWQMQQISASDGYGGHGSLNAEFGLGTATIIDELKIEWPSRAVQTLNNVSVNQALTIREPR